MAEVSSQRYREQHYEDVAKLLEEHHGYVTADVVVEDLIRAFADLFAADNPSHCYYCHTNKKDIEGPDCTARVQPFKGHSYVQGFDREKFLAACGLEKEGV